MLLELQDAYSTSSSTDQAASPVAFPLSPYSDNMYDSMKPPGSGCRHFWTNSDKSLTYNGLPQSPATWLQQTYTSPHSSYSSPPYVEEVDLTDDETATTNNCLDLVPTTDGPYCYECFELLGIKHAHIRKPVVVLLQDEKLQEIHQKFVKQNYVAEDWNTFTGVQEGVDMFKFTDNSIRLLIKFAKQIEGFQDLCEDDHLSLVRGGWQEFNMVYSSMVCSDDASRWILYVSES